MENYRSAYKIAIDHMKDRTLLAMVSIASESIVKTFQCHFLKMQGTDAPLDWKIADI